MRRFVMVMLVGLVAPIHARAEDRAPQAVYSYLEKPADLRRFERSPDGWTAAFTSERGWRGTRGFRPESQGTHETGFGWFSDGRNHLYRGITAPRRMPHAICEGRLNADHTQLNAQETHRRVMAGEPAPEVAGGFDMIVAFADDETERTREALNCFFQIFERSTEHGYRPAYGLFFAGGRLQVGAWDDNPPIPDVVLERKTWYRIRFDVQLREDGARTVMSIWTVGSDGARRDRVVKGLVIDHAKGLRHSGVARYFPVIIGSYTWGLPTDGPSSMATLIAGFRQGRPAAP